MVKQLRCLDRRQAKRQPPRHLWTPLVRGFRLACVLTVLIAIDYVAAAKREAEPRRKIYEEIPSPRQSITVMMATVGDEDLQKPQSPAPGLTRSSPPPRGAPATTPLSRPETSSQPRVEKASSSPTSRENSSMSKGDPRGDKDTGSAQRRSEVDGPGMLKSACPGFSILICLRKLQ
jgi:type IV secretory pathway VirB10-like protein